MGAAEEHPILDRDRIQLAGAHADEGEPLGGDGLRHHPHTVGVALGVPQAQHRRMQKFLPRMRTDGIAEKRLVVAAHEPVAPAVLLVGPAPRQIGERDDIVVDDGLVANGRTDHAIAPPPQRVNQRLQPLDRRHGRLGGVHRACLDLVSTASCPMGPPLDHRIGTLVQESHASTSRRR